MELSGPTNWLDSRGSDDDVVLSCRARLARNLAGFPFVGKASPVQRGEVLALAKQAILDARLDETMLWVELNHAAPRDRKLLVERHLISAQLAEGSNPRAVAVSGNESLSLMVNEEDHLRMQVLLPGFQTSRAFDRIANVEHLLEQRLEFAFSKRFGYLTACPTNIGTGLRLGVMMHLPGLKITGEIDRLRRASKDLHLAVRGFFGEGTESSGDFFQISNQVTLGVSEEQILEEFETHVVPQLIEYERAARNVLIERRATLLDDRIFRALGILRNARLISSEEAMKMLSRVRLGAHLGRIGDIDPAVIDRLYPQIQPAHLQQDSETPLKKDQIKEARAELIRKALG